MERHLTNIKESLFEVYSNRTYFIPTFFFSFITYSSNSLLRNYKLLLSNFSLKLFFSLVFSTHKSISFSSLIILIAISLLSGIVFTMSIFLIKRQITSGLGVGVSGVIVGLLAPACPSCAFGLLSLLGIGGFLTFLPFKGLEIGFLGIIILLGSIVYLSKKITTKVCEVK